MRSSELKFQLLKIDQSCRFHFLFNEGLPAINETRASSMDVPRATAPHWWWMESGSAAEKFHLTSWIDCCWIEESFHFGINRGQFGGNDWSISGYVVTGSTLPSGRQMSIPVQAVPVTDIVGCMCNMEGGWHVSGKLHLGPPCLHWMGRDWGLVDTLTLRSFLRVVGLSKDSDSLCEVQLGLTNCYKKHRHRS